MDWQKVGKYGMQSGDYRVGKVFIDGCTLYEIFHGYDLLKICNDFAECQEVAETHEAAHG